MGAPTQTSIVNAALAELGSTQRIQSIDDDTNVARDAKAVWDSTVRELLAEHPWNWAIGRTTLNAAAEAPDFGYTYGYTLPADNLRWLPSSREDGDAHFEGVEEGGLLLSDAEAPLQVRYISETRGARVALWPPKFVRAMQLAIAAKLAEPLTQDESIKSDFEDKAEKALRKAKRADGLASNNRARTRITAGSDWLRARDLRYNRFGR